MTPVCSDAHAVLDLITGRMADAEPAAIRWRTGDVLVIDNWHMLHGRGLAGKLPSPDRSLFRVAVQ
jgi:alpha-ketoglutarate-dependent taurine dioxygenase